MRETLCFDGIDFYEIHSSSFNELTYSTRKFNNVNLLYLKKLCVIHKGWKIELDKIHLISISWNGGVFNVLHRFSYEPLNLCNTRCFF